MSLKAIQIATLLGSGIISGAGFYISAFAIPALLSPYNKGQVVLPAKALQTQWQYLYDTGFRFFPTLAALNTSAYLYLAYNSPNTRPLYLFSAFCSIGIVPYTLLGMMGNIKKIQAKIKDQEDLQDVPRLRDDIATWGTLNYGRVALQFAAFVVGTWAVVNST